MENQQQNAKWVHKKSDTKQLNNKENILSVAWPYQSGNQCHVLVLQAKVTLTFTEQNN